MPQNSGENDVCNDALGQIGEAAITDISDNNTRAHWCRVNYPNVRRALLRLHHWNFAEARGSLTPDATPPAFEFAYSFQLPPQLLKIKTFNGASVNAPGTYALPDPFYWMTTMYYKIEGVKLLTNYGEAKIIYVQDVPDVTKWDPLFYQACACWLAGKLASAIRKDHKMSVDKMNTAFALFLGMAAGVDGQEGGPEAYPVDDLLWGR